MEYRELGKSGLTVSQIGMGCVTFGREIDEASSFAVADRAFERGITLFDTADTYAAGASETVLGKWIKDRGLREKIVLATKVGAPVSSYPMDKGCSARHIIKGLENSLRRLQVEYLDLYLVHLWDPDVPPLETLEALSQAVEQGKVRAIGCSNYAAWQMCRMLWLAEVGGLEPMQVVQPPYSLVRGRDQLEKEWTPLCEDQNVGIISYSPLGAGLLTGKYRKNQPSPKDTRFDIRPGHQDRYFHDSSFDIVEALRAKAEQMHVSMIQLALAWVLSQPAVSSMLIGARTIGQVDQAFEALEFGMDDGLRAELSSMDVQTTADS